MQIAQSSWHARVYKWTRKAMQRFYNNPYHLRYKNVESSNLCTYCRTVFLYFPLLILWYTASLVAPPALLFGVPLYFVGMKSTLLVWGVLLGVVGAAFSAVAVLSYFIDSHLKKRRQRREDPDYRWKERKPWLVVEWAKARKRNVCPLIEFTE